jgi:WD40 repeat protein
MRQRQSVWHTAGVWSANFSPDGKQIVSTSADKNLKLWDLAGNCLQTFVGHTDEVLSANFSPDGKQIVSASMEICIWQLSPAQPSWQLQQLWHNDYLR